MSRLGRRVRSLVSCLLLWAGVADRSLAADPMLLAGHAPNTVQHGGDTGSVNVLSGALNLNIPLGPSYPVNDSLSYQVVLSYSSRTGRYYIDGTPGSVPWMRGRSPVGWSWVLHFGRISEDMPGKEEMLGYQSPDGSWHALWPSTAPEDCLGAAGPGGTCWLTRDGTHLRAGRIANGWVLWTPDGIERRLEHEVTRHWSCDVEHAQPWLCHEEDDFAGWYTTEILDPLGEAGANAERVRIHYEDECLSRIEDDVHGTTVTFENGTRNGHCSTEKITFETAAGPATYGLVRGLHPPRLTGCDPGEIFGLDVDLLTAIEAPEDLVTTFNYDTDEGQHVGTLEMTVYDQPGDLARTTYKWDCLVYSHDLEPCLPGCPDCPAYCPPGDTCRQFSPARVKAVSGKTVARARRRRSRRLDV